MKRIWAATIWADKSARPGPRSLYQVGIPVGYALFVLLGLSAIYFGAPVLTEVFDAYFVTIYGIWQAALAAIALIGYVIPRWPYIEAIGLNLLTGQYTLYTGSLLLLTAEGDPTRGYVFVISIFALSMLFVRIALLASEIQESNVLRNMGK